MEKRNIHYAWFILAGCCILQGASLGLVNNCAGVFYSPVCEELGFEMGRFSLYRMLFSISSALMLPAVAKSFRRFDVRVVISAAAVVFGGCGAAMGTFDSLWQWYAAGTIQGIASAFLCMVPAPILLSNWFHRKTGTAIGISAAFSGLAGMLGSSGLGVMIPAFGWRASYVIVGALSTALILPVSVFVLRYRPEDKNMRAYGAEENTNGRSHAEDAGKTAGSKVEAEDVGKTVGSRTEAEAAGGVGKAAVSGREEKTAGLSELLHQPIFYVALLSYAGSIASSYLNMFLTSCGLAAGLSMTTAAMMTALSLFGNMSSKLVLGKASDTCGVIRTFQAAVLISAAGHLLLFSGFKGSVMAGALLFGITLPLSSVMLPLFCRLFWKGETYGAAYSYVSMFGTLLASPFNMLFGTFYDLTGTYRLTIGVSLGFMLVVLLLVGAGGRVFRRSPLRG